MRLLLDTHTLLWWLTDDPRLGREARREISNPDNSIFVSAVSAYEITQKYRRGKLPDAAQVALAFETEIAGEGFIAMSISVAAARLAGQIEHDHRDPFDRLLIGQALTNDLTIVSNERLFDSFGVARIW